MEDQLTDDQSHYEISLTAGQAFLAFVLLLLSLAASFAFGLMIGKGQGDERLVVRREPSIIHEGSLIPKKASGKIVELGVVDSDFKADDEITATATTDSAAANVAATITEGSVTVENLAPPTPAPEKPSASIAPPPAALRESAPIARETKPATVESKPATVEPKPVAPTAPPTAGPAYAQLLSTGDQKVAEALAARLIDRGFTAAYVERGSSEKGPVFRVRVRFPSDGEARAAEARLREFSKEVWITRQ